MTISKVVTEATYLEYYLEEEVNSNLTYIGRTRKQGIPFATLTGLPYWQIIRKTKQGLVVKEETIPGRKFNQIWNDRNTLFPDTPYFNQYSLSYNAVNKYVDVPHNASIDFSNLQPWSAVFWIKSESTSGYTYVAKQTGGVGYRIYKNADETIEVEIRGTGGLADRIRVRTTNAVASILDQWQMVGVTYDGSSLAAGLKIYVNGAIEVLDAPLNNGLVTSSANGGNLAIGANTGGGSYFGGLMDEVGLWNVELDAANILALYNGGNPIDTKADSGNYNQSANLISVWEFTEDDRQNLPIIADQQGTNNGTGVNVLAGNFFTEVPAA